MRVIPTPNRYQIIDSLSKACVALKPLLKHTDPHGIANVVNLIAFSVDVDLTIPEFNYLIQSIKVTNHE